MEPSEIFLCDNYELYSDRVIIRKSEVLATLNHCLATDWFEPEDPEHEDKISPRLVIDRWMEEELVVRYIMAKSEDELKLGNYPNNLIIIEMTTDSFALIEATTVLTIDLTTDVIAEFTPDGKFRISLGKYYADEKFLHTDWMESSLLLLPQSLNCSFTSFEL